MVVPFRPVLDLSTLDFSGITDFLPLEGLWDSTGLGKLLVILVFIRLVLFAFTARSPKEGSGQGYIGDFLMYIVSALFLPLGFVIAIMFFHFAKLTWFKNSGKNLSENLPAQEHSAEDMIIFYVAVMLALITSIFPNLSGLWAGISFTPGLYIIWFIGLLILLSVSSKGLRGDAGVQRKAKGISLVLLFIFLGSNAFMVYIIYLMVAPFIGKFNLISRSAGSVHEKLFDWKFKIPKTKDGEDTATAKAMGSIAEGMEKMHASLFARMDELEKRQKQTISNEDASVDARLRAVNARLDSLNKTEIGKGDDRAPREIDDLEKMKKYFEKESAQQTRGAQSELQRLTAKFSEEGLDEMELNRKAELEEISRQESGSEKALDVAEAVSPLAGPEGMVIAEGFRAVKKQIGRTFAKTSKVTNREGVPRSLLLLFLLSLANDVSDWAFVGPSPNYLGIGFDIITLLFLSILFAKIPLTKFLLVALFAVEVWPIYWGLFPWFTIYLIIGWFLDSLLNKNTRAYHEARVLAGEISGEMLTFRRYFFAIILIIVVFAVILPQSGVFINPANLLQDAQQTTLKAREEAVGWELYWKDRNPITEIKNWWQRNFIDPIVSDYDIAEVEKYKDYDMAYKINRRKNIINTRLTQESFASFDIAGKSLNMEDCKQNSSQEICSVLFRCEAEGGLATSETPFVSIREIEDGGAVLTCKYTPISTGNNDITGITLQHGKAKSYVISYMVPKEIYDVAQKEKDTDLALKKLIGVGQLNPIARSTGGPVKIGIGIAGGWKDKASGVLPIEEKDGKYYIGYSESVKDQRGEDFGFTITKNWNEGKILRVDSATITIPHYLRVDKCTSVFGSHEFELQEKNDEKDVSVYKLAKPITEEIENGLPIDCKIYANEVIDPEIRGAKSIENMRVSVEYLYEQRQSVRAVVTRGARYDEIKENDYSKGADVCAEDIKNGKECGKYTQAFCVRDPCALGCYWEPEKDVRLQVPWYVYSVAVVDPVSQATLVANDFLGYDECQSCADLGDGGCSDYKNENNCRLDPCGRQCEWDKERSECWAFNTELTIGSPIGNKEDGVSQEIRVVKCDDNNVITIRNFEILSMDSGILNTNGDTAELTIPGGYKIIYSGILSFNRYKGNIVRGEMIGYSKEDTFKLQILKDNTPLTFKQITELYSNKQRINEVRNIVWSKQLNSGCEEKVEA